MTTPPTAASLPHLPDYLPGGRPATQFKHTFTLHTPAFATLPPLRRNISERIAAWQLPAEYVSTLLFTVTEIMTNLVKHPVRKAETVRIHLCWEDNMISLDISDDSTPFASFMAKCNGSAQTLTASDDMTSGGFGLSCLRALHKDMRYIPADESVDLRNHFIVQTPWAGPELKSPMPLSPPRHPTPADGGIRVPLVCLIDDNPVTLSMHSQLLQLHYRVSSFTIATDALDSFSTALPDLIIADISLGDMDGVTFRKRLAEIDGGSQIPFVFLTAHNGRHQEIEANLTGIDDFLCKPVSSERLLSISARLIRRSQQIASSVQNSFDRKINRILYPELPRLAHGWRLATRSSRAEAGGGDFILYHNEQDRIFGIVADVMGHGRDAKFFSCAYAGYLRSFLQVLRPACSPGPFLDKLSAALHTDSFFDLSAMTCLAFELGAGGQAHLAVAGHPPPSLCTRHTQYYQANQLNLSGPLPGLVADSTYTETVLHLQAGDRLLLATDGYWNITERREALHAALQAAAKLDIERAADLLWQAHIDHNLRSQRTADDTTLVLLEAGDLK